MKNVLALFSLTFALFVFSCGKDDGGDPDPSNCDTTDLTYTDDIKAILDTNCALSSCHSETEAMMQGSMHDYDAAKAFVANQLIIEAINHEEGVEAMPRPEGSAKLSDCTIDKIEAWVANGTPE
jgi:mono/diheme cytochrome c family protein